MKGDFSRITFDPRKHYSGVRMQQGRVQLDADWNEQADILEHRRATETRDLVGGSGAPEGSPGFRILPRYGLDLDGRDDYVLVEHAQGLRVDARAPFTLEAWIELRDPGAGGAVVSAPGGTYLGVGADGVVAFRVGAADGSGGTDASVVGKKPLEFGRRLHLAAAWDGEACTLYVDGTDVDTVPEARDGSAAADRFSLGAHLAGRSASDFFAGSLEEARVWSVARGEAEVRRDMGSTPTGREDGLLACWVFHEGQGTRVHDLAGSGAVAVLGGGSEASRPEWTFQELRIGRGRYYVDGSLCENDDEVSYDAQPDLPGVTLPDGDGSWLVYLDTFERLLTVHEEPALREVALGGPDTTARTRTVWQVRLLPLDADEAAGAGEASLERLGGAAPAGTLAVRRERGPTVAGNHLFRVEIHCGGGAYGWPRPTGPAGQGVEVVEVLARADGVRVAPGDLEWHPGQLVEVWSDRTEQEQKAGDLVLVADALPSDDGGTWLTLDPFPAGLTLDQGPRVRPVAGFKWSRDNGSIAFAVRSLDTRMGVASVHDLGADASALDLQDWVEAADDGYLLRARPTPLRRVLDVDRLNRRVTLDVKDARLPTDLGQDPARRPVLRRWDQGTAEGLLQGIRPVTAGTWIDLADGVQVRFGGGSFRVADFWTLPVRVVGASGIEWPAGEDGPLALPPQGIRHRHVALARLHREGTRARVEDLRTVFAPLSALGGDYVRRTGAETMTGPLTVERGLTVGREAVVRGGLAVEGSAAVGGDLAVEGELFAALPRRSVGTPQLRDRSVTYAKLAGDVGLVPPGAFIFGETPYAPTGYEWTGGHLSIPNDEPHWHELPPLPYAHSARVHAVAAEGVIYLFSERVAEVYRYVPAARVWEPVTLIPRMRRDFAAAEVGGRLYVVGGAEPSGRPCSWVDAYDPDVDVWERIAPLPTPRSSLGVAAVGGFLYAVGGRRHTVLGSLPTARNEVYDPLGNRWTEARGMGTRRCRMGVATVGGKLHVVGGEHLEELLGRVTSLHESYDPGADRWRRLRRMPTRRMSLAVAVVNGKLYALGGETSERITTLVEEYDPATNGWAERAPLTLGRKDFGALGLGGKVYAMGGQTPHGPTHSSQDLALVTAYYPYRKLYDDEHRRVEVYVEEDEEGVVEVDVTVEEE